MHESLVLSDYSQRDVVVDVLASLDLPMLTGRSVEMALDYPGQQLAVDLYATTQDDLDSAVTEVREALRARGIAARPAMEIEAERALHASA